jgi:hypothetical protein
MSVPQHLTISIEGLSFDILLADWRWLVPENFNPILMTAFGNLFLHDGSDRIHLLNLMTGELKVVAASQYEFEEACESREQRQSWFLGFLLMELKSKHGPLQKNDCYSCKIPLSLGGQLEADNFEPVDLQTHYSILGQLHRQTNTLPPGAKIQKIKVTPPKSEGTIGKS